MENYKLDEELRLVCVRASSFPAGIQAAYEELEKLLGKQHPRKLYGLSYWDEKRQIVYKAAATELYIGEAESLGAEYATIPPGKYICKTISDFRQHIEKIGQAFSDLLQDPRTDKKSPFVEKYSDNFEDVVCMVRLGEDAGEKIYNNKEIVEKVNAAFRNNDIDTFLSFCAEDVKWVMVGDAAIKGKTEIRKFLQGIGATNTASTITRVFGDGERIACEGSMRMVLKSGELAGCDFCDVYLFNEGKIAELNSYIIEHPKVDTKELFDAFDEIVSDFLQTLTSASEDEINAVPYEDSWTAAQLADHVIQSYSDSTFIIEKGLPSRRDAGERIQEFRDIFLDLRTRMKSPDYVLPRNDKYKKKELLEELNNAIASIKDIRTKADLSEIIKHPKFGDITKLEILNFFVVHTQRHLYQLNNILKTVKARKQLKGRL